MNKNCRTAPLAALSPPPAHFTGQENVTLSKEERNVALCTGQPELRCSGSPTSGLFLQQAFFHLPHERFPPQSKLFLFALTFPKPNRMATSGIWRSSSGPGLWGQKAWAHIPDVLTGCFIPGKSLRLPASDQPFPSRVVGVKWENAHWGNHRASRSAGYYTCSLFNNHGYSPWTDTKVIHERIPRAGSENQWVIMRESSFLCFADFSSL